MSLDENFTQKLNIDQDVSATSSTSNQSQIGNQENPTSTGISGGDGLLGSMKGGGKNEGRRSRSPNRMLSFSIPDNSPPPSYNEKNHIDPTNSRPNSGSGSPTPIRQSRDRTTDKVHSAKLTRKIFNNWRSACGKTKDKTKDYFIKRWKTLPENHPDFENLVSAAQAQHIQQQQVSSTSSATMTGMTNAPSEISSLNKMKILSKKASEGDGVSKDPGSATGVGDQILNTKSSAGWSVHVWATWVQRGPNEEDIETKEKVPDREFLSEFQKTKLTYFFRHVLDMNHDDVISAEDFVALNQRIRHYVEWSSECIEFHVLKEVHSGFLECFLNQPLDECSNMYYCNSERETRHHVNIDEWLDVWGSLLHSAKSLRDLPLWLQYFPKILFQVINKSGSGTISKEELRAFYTMFLGIDFRIVNETLDSIIQAMTDDGKYSINYSLYKLCFANFLLAKQVHGPGQYIFGICQPSSLPCSFPIDYSALNTPPSELEPYDPEKDKSQSNRRSVVV